MSLRALMIAVLVLGGGLGWLVRRAHLQRRAVAALTARGGRVAYDWQVGYRGTGSPPVGPTGPQWLRRWIGDEFFQTVNSVVLMKPATPEDLTILAELGPIQAIGVNNAAQVEDGFGRLADPITPRFLRVGAKGLPDPGLTDAALVPVGRWTTLEELYIVGASITDDGLDSLQTLSRLKTLNLTGCSKLTSAGVARLIDRLPSLEKLVLQDVPVGDAALPAVGRLASLKVLDLKGTDVTDAGLAHLAHLIGLQRLSLGGWRTLITDAGLVPLGRLTALEGLSLSRTRITDAGLVQLPALLQLRQFFAYETAISDAGTPVLARFKNLEYLGLNGTLLTDAGLPPLGPLVKLDELSVDTLAGTKGEAELHRLLPKLRIFSRNPAHAYPSARPVAVRLGTAPAQGLLPSPATNRPDQPDRPIAGAGKGTAVGSSTEQPGTGGVLARWQDKHRPVVVFAPTEDDSKASRQRNAWVGPLPEAGVKDRDIVVVEVIGPEGKAGDQTLTPDEARDLRIACRVADGAFAVVLIGRDGTEKARWDEPVSPQEIFGRIDAMPMRQAEVEQKGGH